MCRAFVIMGIVSGVLFATQNCYSAKFVEEKTTAHLRTKLGADVQMDVSSVASQDGTTPGVLCPSNHFLVKISEGCYVAIPMSAFKEARMENLEHNITLVNGKTLSGILTGVIFENTNGRFDSRQYDLSNVTFLAIEFTAGSNTRTPVSPQDRWQLACPNSSANGCVLLGPQFGLVYEAGTEVRGRHNRIRWEDVHPTNRFIRNFTVNVGGREMTAAISDFSEIVLRPVTPKSGTPASVLAKRGESNVVKTPPKPGSLEAAAAAARGPIMTPADKAAAAAGGRKGLASLGSQTEMTSSSDSASDSTPNPAAAKITMMSESGIRTSGDLYLMNYDYDWALVAKIEGTGGVVLILLSPQCTIKKIAPPKNATAAANPVPANAVKSEMP